MGLGQHSGSVEAGKSKTSSSVAGVNRRTAVLFGNKTPRRSVQRIGTQSPGSSLSGELRMPRRPGRPPKQPTHTVTDASKTSERTSKKQHSTASEHQEQADEVVPKKRGRKKRSAMDQSAGEFGSRWGEVVGRISTEWSAVAQAETQSSTRRTPQKESFRQYRVMHDSDVEGAPKSDNDRQMASLSSSSSSSGSSDNGNSSSHSDDDDDDDYLSSSSSSPDNSPPAGSSGKHLSFVCFSLHIMTDIAATIQ